MAEMSGKIMFGDTSVTELFLGLSHRNSDTNLSNVCAVKLTMFSVSIFKVDVQ